MVVEHCYPQLLTPGKSEPLLTTKTTLNIRGITAYKLIEIRY